MTVKEVLALDCKGGACTCPIMGKRDIDSLRGWLDNYCKENPHKSFDDAVGALMSELHPKRLKDEPQ